MQRIEITMWIIGFSILIIPVVLPLSLTLLTWLTPKSVIDRYVCPPYFSEFESSAYRYFPTSWIRTLLFSLAISIPIFRRIRGFGDMQKQVPLWFNVASRLFVYVVLGYLFSVCIAIGILVVIATFGLHK